MATPLPRFAVEAVAVAAIFAALCVAIHVPAMRLLGAKRAMDHRSLALQAAMAGLLGHVLLELLGVNAWYCKQRRSG